MVLHESKKKQLSIQRQSRIKRNPTDPSRPNASPYLQNDQMLTDSVYRYYFLRLLLLGAVLEETLAARDVEAELDLLPPLTALTCLFCCDCTLADIIQET